MQNASVFFGSPNALYIEYLKESVLRFRNRIRAIPLGPPLCLADDALDGVDARYTSVSMMGSTLAQAFRQNWPYILVISSIVGTAANSGMMPSLTAV